MTAVTSDHSDSADLLRRSVSRYREGFGWPVHTFGTTAVLSCDGPVTAVSLPSSWAGELTHRLLAARVHPPVLATGHGHPRWLFLAGWGDMPIIQPAVLGARVMRRTETIVLPTIGGQPSVARWVIPPDDGEPPSVATILAAVRGISPDTRAAGLRFERSRAA